jgi:hypothetical protein
MQCCGAQLFLPEHSFIFFSAAPFPFLEPVHSLGSAFPALPEGQASAVFPLPPFFSSVSSLFCPDGPAAADADASHAFCPAFVRRPFRGRSAMVGPVAYRLLPLPCRPRSLRLPRLDVLPGFTPERAALLPMGGRVFSDPRMPLLPVFPAFSATVFCRSRPIVFRCKVRVPTGTTCQILTNGVAAQIFLYRACGLGLRPKIKRIYALSLVHPSAAPTF